MRPTVRAVLIRENERKVIMMLRTGLVAIALVICPTATGGASLPAPPVAKIVSSTVEPSTPGVADAAPVRSTTPAVQVWPAQDYPPTPGDRNGYPIKSCGATNDGEQVSTFAVDLDGKQCVVRNFRCGSLNGEWVWFHL